jgi:hypothetical protein
VKRWRRKLTDVWVVTAGQYSEERIVVITATEQGAKDAWPEQPGVWLWARSRDYDGEHDGWFTADDRPLEPCPGIDERWQRVRARGMYTTTVELFSQEPPYGPPLPRTARSGPTSSTPRSTNGS